MIYPQFEQVVAYARHFNVIPICQTFLADTETPIGLFQKCRQDDGAFLLESAEGASKWARYSFVGSDPFLTFTAKDGKTFIRRQNGEQDVQRGNPLRQLQQLVSQFHCPQYEDFPPFLGGCVGAIGYESMQYVKQVPVPEMDPMKSPDLHFMFYDRLFVFDHLKQQIIAVQLLRVPPNEAHKHILREQYEAVKAKLNQQVNDLQNKNAPRAAAPALDDGETEMPLSYRSNMTKEMFMTQVEKAQAFIRAGNVKQVVLSQRLEVDVTTDPFDVYRVLRTLNPSPYMYFLQMGEETIVGASPEVLVKVTNGMVEVRPIAGTRKCGKSADEDQQLAEELRQDKKEQAEHRMLVDLSKKEIEHVAKEGTVELKQFMDVEHYSHVMHMVSHITGQLKKELRPFEALVSCFPAGTVSGAPKTGAMEIIAELEGERRGVYAGGIGYMAFSGNLDACIAIRTIVFKRGKAYIQAGAGIVRDSIPEHEYDESLNKARALLTALARAETIFKPVAQRS